MEVLATHWNCPEHIPVLLDTDEVEAIVRPLEDRIAELEAALAGD